MLSRLPGFLQGLIMAVLLILNTLFWAVPLFILVLFKLLTPAASRARVQMSRAVAWVAQRWAMMNAVFGNALLDYRFDLRLDADLHPEGQYLVCANHQTWNDIYVLMCAFGGRAPFFKFFLKQELIWVPVLGLAWWGLDYPFMKRYTPEQIRRNPALKGKDIETTKRACERYRDQPVMILNFLEGTRFTPAKHARQQSPYQHLLKPKAGGFAFALGAMGPQLNSLLDVTIVYPGGPCGFWDFLCGRMRHVVVDVRKLEIPADFFEGRYESDAMFRARFQRWISALWRDKDARIDALLSEMATPR
jgi:1-acyl-sn-glycerol-3-phosphate acyltransferase